MLIILYFGTMLLVLDLLQCRVKSSYSECIEPVLMAASQSFVIPIATLIRKYCLGVNSRLFSFLLGSKSVYSWLLTKQ